MTASTFTLDNLDVPATIKAIAVGRIALGASYVLAAGPALKVWPGRGGSTAEERAMQRLLARSIGGRDLALAIGSLLALSHDKPVRGWVEAAMLADAIDAVAIGLALRRVPRVLGVLLFAGSVGTALVERKLASSLA